MSKNKLPINQRIEQVLATYLLEENSIQDIS